MEAAQYEVGGPEKLTTGTVPVPVPKEHEILIRVYASAINRADTLQVSERCAESGSKQTKIRDGL